MRNRRVLPARGAGSIAVGLGKREPVTAEWSQHSNYLQHVSFTEELMGNRFRTRGARHSE
jgi:hypothetical protein